MNLKEAKIGVLLGGYSRERKVSIASGENVYVALKGRGYKTSKIDISSPAGIIPSVMRNHFDVAFNCLHGGIGEDGTLQALLEVFDIPYTGSPVLTNVLAMNKLKAKKRFQIEGIPTPPYLEWPEDVDWEKFKSKVIREIGFPVVAKPVSEGSSLGVRILKDSSRLEDICPQMESEHGSFFIEKYIPGREVTCGILRKESRDIALPLIELRTETEFYDYTAKYSSGMTEFIIPAELDNETTERVKNLALTAHRALGCFGFSRVDFRVNPPDEIYALEVNTVPGMTKTSDLPKAAKHLGIQFDSLVEYMLKTICKKD